MSIFVSLGCYSKNTIDRNLFFTVLEARKSKIKIPANLFLGEGSLLDLQTDAFTIFSHGQETDISPMSLLIKALVPGHLGGSVG